MEHDKINNLLLSEIMKMKYYLNLLLENILEL